MPSKNDLKLHLLPVPMSLPLNHLPYYLVLFENRTKPGTVLSETVLSGDPLYLGISANVDEKEDDNVTSEMISPHYVRILLKYYT